jgi:NTP pyrophosphatase (non-canonical NTP hydrolase)
MSALTAMKVCGEVMDERRRQDAKWGKSSDRPAPPLSVLVEEVGEVANAMLTLSSAEEGGLRIVNELRTELIQVAAVAVAMVEAIDRGDVPR